MNLGAGQQPYDNPSAGKRETFKRDYLSNHWAELADFYTIRSGSTRAFSKWSQKNAVFSF